MSHTIGLGSLRHLVMTDTVDTGAAFRCRERLPNERCHGEMRIFRLLELSRMGYKSETKSLLFASSHHHTQVTQQYQANQTTPSSKPFISKHAVLQDLPRRRDRRQRCRRSRRRVGDSYCCSHQVPAPQWQVEVRLGRRRRQREVQLQHHWSARKSTVSRLWVVLSHQC